MKPKEENGALVAAPKAKRGLRAHLSSALAAAVLAACGGGGNEAPDTAGNDADRAHGQAARHEAQGEAVDGAAHAAAFRLLTQATFGPTDADIQDVLSRGIAGWVDHQLRMPPQGGYLRRWNHDDRTLRHEGGAGSQTVDSAIYQAAMKNPDQLRQRVAYALSQIFVVSMVEKAIGNAKSNTTADYYDMLSRNAFGNFRDLLQDVAMHPAMGQYLSSLGNSKEDPAVGSIPDQNFAREVMQLFTIGLVELNLDGTPKKVNGRQVYTYAQRDIEGLSRVFTGWGWYGPDNSQARWKNNADVLTPDRMWNPMQAYPDYHSTSQKKFLGTVIPPQDTPNPAASRKVAINTLFAHPNVGPFISKQLIQRLVTSNPTPGYIERVAKVFNDDGHHVRGNLKAVVRAILLDPEARRASNVAEPTFGKVREPVLRLTAFLRAFDAKSDSGLFLIGSTDDPGHELAQTPLRAESVFNFYRPGYVNAGGATARNGLVAPELQITTESSVAGYANFMFSVLQNGIGEKGLSGDAQRPDVQANLASAVQLADDPQALVDDVTGRLIGDTVNDELKSHIRHAVESIAIPAWNKDHSNGDAIDRAKTNRAKTAVLITLASPEYIVQK
jgi:uncharacterized protein (DUF1800 family)